MKNQAMSGLSPLVWGMRGCSVGTVYGGQEVPVELENSEPSAAAMEVVEQDLKAQGVEEEEKKTEKKLEGEDEDTNKTLLLVGGIGAVVLLAGVAVIAMRKR